MSKVIVISHIKVQAANLQTSGLILGGAPLMAAAMFAHNLARQTGMADKGIVFIHHDRQDLGGFAYGNFTPAQRRGSVFINKIDYSSKNKHALSLQPTASCHLHFSLLIKVDAKRIFIKKITDFLRNARFAGGKILEFGDVKALDGIAEALNKIKIGYVLIDRQDVLQHYAQAQNFKRLQAFTELLSLSPEGLQQVFGAQHRLSWLSATNLGYALLEAENVNRTGVRQAYDKNNQPRDTPHAYAEPLIGLVQYVSLNQLLHPPKPDDNEITADSNPIAEPLRKLSEDLTGLWWHYQWQSKLGGDVFLLSQE